MAMSKNSNRIEAAMCGDKVRHSTPLEAFYHKINRMYILGVPFRCYKCRFCHSWHVGRFKLKESENIETYIERSERAIYNKLKEKYEDGWTDWEIL